MSADLAILAGGGALPGHLAAACPAALRIPVTIGDGFDVALAGILDTLRAHGIRRVVMAGSVLRPAGLPGGDDALLRAVAGRFAAEGIAVLGAHEVLPDLVVGAGHLAGPALSEAALSDLARARHILDTLGPADVAQAAVVAGGLCLGIETAQGTDAMLDFVARTRPAGAGGVLLKMPKPGQDLRLDMPVIGPQTLALAARARLGGIVITAGTVLVLDRAALCRDADRAGIGLVAVPA